VLSPLPSYLRLALFELIERRFAFQARMSTLVAGATGLWMTYAPAAWDRFVDPRFWWMHAMIAIWAIFTLVLFVAEPLLLHRRLHASAIRDPGEHALPRAAGPCLSC